MTIHSVAICDTEPVAIEGLRTLLAASQDLRLVAAEDVLQEGIEMVREEQPEVAIVDKGFGLQPVLDWICEITSDSPGITVVVWGAALTEAEVLCIRQAGARGVIRKTARLVSMLDCLRTVVAGKPWIDNTSLSPVAVPSLGFRSSLTAREHQVAELVEQGLRNKDIASHLGIQPGTVKIHLKHIFEKTGIHGRYGLALSGLKEKGLLSLPVT